MADNCRLRQSQLAGHAADHAEPGADPGAAEQGVCAAGARAQETLAIPQEEPVARRTWSAKPWQLALGAVVLLLVLWLLL